MVFAHVGGVPVEQALLPSVSGASAALVLARAWLGSLTGRAMDFRPSPDLCPHSGSDAGKHPGKAEAR